MEGGNCTGRRGNKGAVALGDPERPRSPCAVGLCPRGGPEDWGLAQLIDVAEALQLIETNTATQARLAKDFRNLIHPGRAQRAREVCDRGTALTALAAAELVVRDLS